MSRFRHVELQYASRLIMYNGGIAAYFEDTTSLTDAVMGEYMLGLKQQSDEEVRRVQHGE